MKSADRRLIECALLVFIISTALFTSLYFLTPWLVQKDREYGTIEVRESRCTVVVRFMITDFRTQTLGSGIVCDEGVGGTASIQMGPLTDTKNIPQFFQQQVVRELSCPVLFKKGLSTILYAVTVQYKECFPKVPNVRQ